MRQTGGGGLLFRFAVQSCGERGALQTDGLCVDSTHRVPATLGLPRSGVSALSPSTLLRPQAALYGAGPALRAVPVFGSSAKAQTRLGLRFVPSPAEQLRQPGLPGALPGCGAPSPLRPQPRFPRAPVRCVRLVSVLGRWPLAAPLLVDVDHPESQEVFG